jgi:hypothetical protein
MEINSVKGVIVSSTGAVVSTQIGVDIIYIFYIYYLFIYYILMFIIDIYLQLMIR